jgi:hypothetical protein
MSADPFSSRGQQESDRTCSLREIFVENVLAKAADDLSVVAPSRNPFASESFLLLLLID